MFYIDYNEPWYLQELVPFMLIGALGVSRDHCLRNIYTVRNFFTSSRWSLFGNLWKKSSSKTKQMGNSNCILLPNFRKAAKKLCV